MIGIAAFVLTYPVGSVFAAINAHRLRDVKNKQKYILNGILYIIVFIFFGFFFQDRSMTGLIGIANIFLAYSLYNEMQNEIEGNAEKESIIYESWGKAVLIGIGVLVVLGLLVFGFAILMVMFNSQ